MKTMGSTWQILDDNIDLTNSTVNDWCIDITT